jgi:hypothetical protein
MKAEIEKLYREYEDELVRVLHQTAEGQAHRAELLDIEAKLTAHPDFSETRKGQAVESAHARYAASRS